MGQEYEIKELDEGKVVSYIHKGSYHDIGHAYKIVFEYINRKGMKLAGSCREMYLNDPKQTPEAGLLTEIQVEE